MRLPSDHECQRVIRELDGEPMLTQWEADFVRSNKDRTIFTTAQKESVARMMDKYEV